MKDYETPLIEIIKFQEEGIETESTQSTHDLSVFDWFNEEWE